MVLAPTVRRYRCWLYVVDYRHTRSIGRLRNFFNPPPRGCGLDPPAGCGSRFQVWAVRKAHLLHHVGGSSAFPIGCNFENGVVTRFLSTRAEPDASSAWAQHGWQGDSTGLKALARDSRSLAAKNEILVVDRNFHFTQVVQIADDVGPLQF